MSIKAVPKFLPVLEQLKFSLGKTKKNGAFRRLKLKRRAGAIMYSAVLYLMRVTFMI